MNHSLWYTIDHDTKVNLISELTLPAMAPAVTTTAADRRASIDPDSETFKKIFHKKKTKNEGRLSP